MIGRRLVILLGLLLGACSAPPEPAQENDASPTLTAIRATESPAPGNPANTPSPAPLTEATVPIVLEPPEAQPSLTPTPLPIRLPFARLAILRPGAGSQVTSPFRILGYGGPSFNERVELRLYGEDGRLLDEHVTYLLAFPGNAGRYAAEFSFESPWVAEEGRLEVRVFDIRFGRLSQLSTVDLILLSSGTDRVQPAQHGPEKLAILSPIDGQRVAGGRLQVEIAGWVNADVPLTIELLDRQGAVLSAGQVWLDSPGVGQLGTTTLELAYSVPFAQFGRLAVSEPATGIPGMRHYSSVEVFLQP